MLPEILGNEQEEDRTALIINRLAADIAEWARLKGFDERDNRLLAWDPSYQDYVDTVKHMLFVTEAAESVEGIRDGRPDKDLPEFPNQVVEMADLIIRVLHHAAKRFPGQIGLAIIAKMAKNQKRPYRHGKAF